MPVKKTTKKTAPEAILATKTPKAGLTPAPTTKAAKKANEITELLNHLYSIATERVNPSINGMELATGETPPFKYPPRERLKAIELYFKTTGLLPR